MKRHPPKPSLALTIGVVGHRPDRLPTAALDKIKAEVNAALDMIVREIGAVCQNHGECFEGKTLLSLVSPLAEGADRIAAEAALAKGWALDAALPFSADDYAVDFATPESQARFRDLLRQARTVQTLPGDPAPAARPRAYEVAGVTVLSRSDIVLAIWDGGAPRGRGGTTNNLNLAARLGIPVIHIDATGVAKTQLRWRGLRTVPVPTDAIEDCPFDDLDKVIKRLVEELIRPPKEASERASLRSYFQEGGHRLNLRLEFPIFLAVLGVRPIGKMDLLPPKPDILAGEFAAIAEPAQGGDVAPLARAYGWADAIGFHFAQTFRSAFILNFIFAASAVVLSVMSLFAPEKKLWFVVPEIGLIFLIVLNTWTGRKRRWHLRWLESRELAERLRVALMLWILGSRPANFFSGDEPTWTGWYARAIVRGQVPRSGSLAFSGLSDARCAILKLLDDQYQYHKRNTVRMHRLDHRLELIGFGSFVLTLVAAVLYVAVAIVLPKFGIEIPADETVKHIVVAITAGLPALATATYGIRVIGDFEGVAKRSKRTLAVLEQLMTAAKDDPIDLALLRGRAQTAADSMLGDVSSWRLAVESRTLAIPG